MAIENEIKVNHAAYTAEEIKAWIGTTPRVNEETGYWMIWDAKRQDYVDTPWLAFIGDFEDIHEAREAAEKAAVDSAQSAQDAVIAADRAAEFDLSEHVLTEPDELEDYNLEAGSFVNAGAGWNTFTFREAFESVPTVTCQALAFEGWVEVQNVTETGFQYRLRTMSEGSVSTGSFYTAAGTAADSTHSANTLVSGVTLPAKSTSSSAVTINYIAIEYGGER